MSTTDADCENPDDASTTDAERRWKYTNDLLAAWLVMSSTVMLFADAAGYIDLMAAPEMIVVAYSALVGSAVVWSFGTRAIETWRGT